MKTRSVSSDSPPSAPNRSAARVLDVLDLFLGGDVDLTLTEISERLDVPKSTLHGVLHTLRQRGYVGWDAGTKEYSIGMRLVALANAAPIAQLVQARARRRLERLATELEETALLHAFEAGRVVAIDMAESPRSLRYFVQLGQAWPLHATSAGKLYLASLSDADVRALLSDAPLERLTEHTTVDLEAVIADLEEVRRNGWARQQEELMEGVSGFGAPVLGLSGRVVAALTVTGPTERIAPREQDIVALLVAEARGLSDEIQTS